MDTVLASRTPLLVGAAVAGPEMKLRPVRRTGTDGVETESRLDRRDGSAGVQVPLLVRTAVAVPDDHGGTVGGASSVGVQALVAVDPQLPARRVGPALVGATVTVPQLHAGAVARAGVRHV